MDGKKSSEKDDKTVIRPSAGRSSTPRAPLAESKTAPSLQTDQVQELTRIGKVLRSAESSTGFEQARQAANSALANNKILLNNRFVLESIIGSGGMGTVYKARDLRKVEANDANPYVAIKVLNADFQNHPDAFVTLQREASKTTTLAHPNIVTVHDFDRDGPLVFMTMELLDGMDLEKMLREHAGKGLDPKTALGLIRDYCEALSYAHRKNIIHSDFKPGNVFITRDGAKVLDFGIARLTAGARDQDNFDAGKLGALTPAYASLEMIKGEPADPRDDVYAAAVIAYELLTGKHPYHRQPADQALAANLKPERVAGLGKQQWQALEAGLKLNRAERTPSVQAFLQGLTYVRQGLWRKIAAAVLLIATGTLAYMEFFVADDLAGVIATTLQKAATCHESRDYTCAIESAKAVLKLEPGNARAKELLATAEREQVKLSEQQYTESTQRCLATGDFDCARNQLAALRLTAPQSGQIAVIERRIEIGLARESAQRCLAQQQHDCAVEHLNRVLALEPTDAQARALVQKISAKSASDAKQYRESLARAESCFARKDYECSIRFANQALVFKSGDVEAQSLVQKASYAKTQNQESVTRAKTILQQGIACYRKKDFSCAIAKSESALEFAPEMKEALQLKQDAQQEIAKLKGSIAIE